MAAKSKRKGGSFERDVCKAISLAWTGGARDDLFYRTASSGGRATGRARRGKTTANAAGDVAAMDPDGFPLLKAFSFEIKRGYNSHTIQDLLDGMGAVPLYRKWIRQAWESCGAAGSTSWAIIFRRDRRAPLAMFPDGMFPIQPDEAVGVPCLHYRHVGIASGVYVIPLSAFLPRACDFVRRSCSNPSS